MKKISLPILAALCLPSLALAQLADFCTDCTLGLFDDMTISANYGSMASGTPKEIYLGFTNPSGSETGYTQFEFSVAGIRMDTDGILVLSFEPLEPPAVDMGPLPAPADTTAASTGTGGKNVAWAACQAVAGGTRAIAKITLLSFSPVTDKVFKVLRRFPTTNPARFPLDPVLIRCDAPNFTPIRIKGGCYVAGYSGTPPTGCPIIAVNETTWSAVKHLYE